MTRNIEYHEFLDYVEGRKKDTFPENQETTASKQEIGWWKKFQVARAIRHAREGVATPTELSFLARHAGKYYPDTPRNLIIKPTPKQSEKIRV